MFQKTGGFIFQKIAEDRGNYKDREMTKLREGLFLADPVPGPSSALGWDTLWKLSFPHTSSASISPASWLAGHHKSYTVSGAQPPEVAFESNLKSI